MALSDLIQHPVYIGKQFHYHYVLAFYDAVFYHWAFAKDPDAGLRHEEKR